MKAGGPNGGEFSSGLGFPWTHGRRFFEQPIAQTRLLRGRQALNRTLDFGNSAHAAKLCENLRKNKLVSIARRFHINLTRCRGGCRWGHPGLRPGGWLARFFRSGLWKRFPRATCSVSSVPPFFSSALHRPACRKEVPRLVLASSSARGEQSARRDARLRRWWPLSIFLRAALRFV